MPEPKPRKKQADKPKPKGRKVAKSAAASKKASETPDQRRQRAAEIARRLKQSFPNATSALNWSTPLELLVATILSAQNSDVNVNRVTPALFAKYKTASDWASVSQEQLQEEVRECGFFRQKAKAIRATATILDAEYGGQVPRTMEQMLELPGVARKSANVVLGTAYGVAEGIVVDRHVIRVSGRLGFTTNIQPVKIEKDLMEIVPREEWIVFGHMLVLHGRATCTARKPNCAGCPINDLCPSAFSF